MVQFSGTRSSPSDKPFSRRALDLSAYRIFGSHDSTDCVGQQASPISGLFVDFDFEARVPERAGIIIKRRCMQSCALGAQLPTCANESAARLYYSGNLVKRSTFISREEQDVHTKRAIEGAIAPSRFRDVAGLETETMPRSRCHREFLGHTYSQGIGIYAFDVCTEPACEISSDAATATAKVREFGFRAWR
jgi:hypothetical protein